jgi:ABC-type Fe3+-hydroxamate transport system substrate-binding protein
MRVLGRLLGRGERTEELPSYAERVLLYRPEVIFVQERSFFDRIFSEPQWNKVPAVMNRRVYLIPKRPFN